MSVVLYKPGERQVLYRKKVLAENLPAKVLTTKILNLGGLLRSASVESNHKLYHKADIKARSF